MNKIGALALLSLVLLSCRNEAPKEAWRKMDYPVLFSLASKEGNMRAAEKGNSPSASLENERSIENLTVVVFTNRRVSNVPLALEKVITNEQLQKPQGGNGKISFEMGLAGIYHLEIIANAYPSGDAVAKQAFLDKLKQGLSHDQFKKVLFDRALPEHGGTGFAMLSADPIKVETKKQQPADAGKIVLHRLACRFDIFNKLPRELSLTKVTLQNQIKASYLITQKDIPSGTEVTTEKSYTPNNDWFTATLVSGGIYSYENPVPGATKLLLEGTYKDKPWQKVIELKNILEQPIATKRNHLYRIYLTKGNGTTPGGTDPADADQVHYSIEVLDWDDDQSIDYTDDNVLDAEECFKKYSFVASKQEFRLKGGTGYITGAIKVYTGKDDSGLLQFEDELAPNEYTLTLKKGDPSQIIIDDAGKSFTVKPDVPGTGPAVFILTATPKETPSAAQDIEVICWENPLEYLAEYNVNQDGTGFVTDLYATNTSGYFDWATASAKFLNVTFGGKSYHLGSEPEWYSLITGASFFGKAKTFLNAKLSVEVNGTRLQSVEDINNTGTNVSYVLRFKGTGYQSAWKYEWVKENNHQVLRITARNVRDGVTLDDVATETFWQQNREKNIVRIIPACGLSRRMKRLDTVEQVCWYWASTTAEPYTSYFWVTTGGPGSYTYMEVWPKGFRDDGMTIRLFKDTLDEE